MTARRNKNTPEGPFVVDVAEMAGRPGNTRTIERDIDLTEPLGTTVIAIRAGASLELDLLLESIMEGVYVSGTASGTASGECVRCLDPMTLDVEARIDEIFNYPDRIPEGSEPGEVYLVDDSTVDLEAPVRDSIVTALPFQPTCRPDCPGLCATCGIHLSDDPDHAHEDLDPRWQALRGLLDGEDVDGGASAGGSRT